MLTSPAPNPNPDIIAWARNAGGFTVLRVAKRLQVPEDQVAAWEAGRKQPTVRQTMKLAEFYHRPLSLFFQPTPPREVPLAAEYRRLPNVKPGEESPELRLAVRHMLNRRDNALDLHEELDLDVPEFNLLTRPSEDPRAVGERIRAAVGITTETQLGWKDAWQAWREWRNALESVGILVFMFPKVELGEARGLALLDQPLPVAAVNTKEIAEARPYTALHELVHLMLSRANEESAALTDGHTAREWEVLERFAEAAASFALIEEAKLRDAVTGSIPRDIEGVRRLAHRFKVTPLAMATRLRTSGFWTWDAYHVWKSDWDNHVATLPPRKGGFASPVAKTLGRAGRGFSQLVLEAFDTHRITPVEAARYLNLRISQFDDLRKRLVAGSSVGVADE